MAYGVTPLCITNLLRLVAVGAKKALVLERLISTRFLPRSKSNRRSDISYVNKEVRLPATLCLGEEMKYDAK